LVRDRQIENSNCGKRETGQRQADNQAKNQIASVRFAADWLAPTAARGGLTAFMGLLLALVALVLMIALRQLERAFAGAGDGAA
jgi:hypothetical protein